MDFSLERVTEELEVILRDMDAPLGFYAVGLQFPEGLIEQAADVSDALGKLLVSVNGIAIEYLIFSDVLYGACNIDDIGCTLMGVSALIHFGHSKIIPDTLVKVIYVPVLDTRGSASQIAKGLMALCAEKDYKTVALVTTAQFTACLSYVQPILDEQSGIKIVGQAQDPLPQFEILGCTCRRFPPGTDAVISVVDGDFHYEAACLSNAHLPIYRLSPVTGEYESVGYDAQSKIQSRYNVIKECVKALKELTSMSSKSAVRGKVGLIFGTLGRQGSPLVFHELLIRMRRLSIPIKIFSISEVLPQYLLPHKDVIFFAQCACPRLTLDWDQELTACGLVMLNYYELDKALTLYSQGEDVPLDIEDHVLVNFTRVGHQELCYYGRSTPQI